MFKYFLLGVGFMFLIEGLLYFFFTQQMKDMMKIIEGVEIGKIKSIATVLSIIGVFLIYFTIKSYNTNY